MEKGKINMIILILLILIVLVLGVGIGTYVGMNLNNKLNVSQENDKKQLGEQTINKPENKKLEETEKNSEQKESENIISNEEVKYDGEKKIFVNEEIARVSYNNELIEKSDNDSDSKYKTTIFINDKEMKQIDTYGWGKYDGTEIEVSIIKDSQSHKKEYILITINNTNSASPVKEFIITDENGNILKELRRTGADALYLLDNNVNMNKCIKLKTHIIESDSITLYYSKDPSEDCTTTSIIEKTYKIVNGQVEEKVSDEVRLKGLGYAGK